MRVGDRVRLIGRTTGIVEHMGSVDFTDDQVIGVILDKWHPNANNGFVKGKQYFTAPPGRGYFAKKSSIIENLGNFHTPKSNHHKAPSPIDPNLVINDNSLSSTLAPQRNKKLLKLIQGYCRIQSNNLNIIDEIMSMIFSKYCYMVKIGDIAELDGKKSGIIKYIGKREHSLNEEVIGIDLTKGSYDLYGHDGRGYFETSNPTSGVFKTWEEIKRIRLKLEFKIGDRVKLKRGKTGIIKFIGEVEFAQGEVIGLELDATSPCGHDGTVRGKKYFEAAHKRGYFTRKSFILYVITSLAKPLQKRKGLNSNESRSLQIGDKIRFKSSIIGNTDKRGIIRYIGYPLFADGEVIGIELDEWNINASDGSVNGVKIFDAPVGRGIFASRDEIEKYDPDKERLEEIKKDLKLGDTVMLTSNRRGEVKYIGPVTGQDEMIGVELESWSPDAKDGRFDGFRYFTAPDGHGVFVCRSGIIDLIPSENDANINLSAEAKTDVFNNKYDETIKIQSFQVLDRVELEGGRTGTIRYIGPVEYSGTELIGIELDNFNAQAHDGRGYFVTTKGYGHAVFKRIKQIKTLMSVANSYSNDDGNKSRDSSVHFKVNDRIRLQNGRTGIIRWIGKFVEHDIDENKNQCVDHNGNKYITDRGYYGIELDIEASTANEGYCGNVKYFDCAPNRGIFVSLSAISDHLGSTTTNKWSIGEYTSSLHSISFRETDRVQVLIGGSGTIRYLGNPGFIDDLMYGIELDEWSPNASNGIINGQQFFDCQQGKCFFVNKESIIKYIGIYDSAMMKADDMNLPQLTKMPKIKDKVKLVDGQIGVICFIGMVEFSNDTYIGVRLDQWSPNGNDGSISGKRYFRCDAGYGYFIKLRDIVAHLGSIISNPFKDNTGKNSLKMNDRVTLHNTGAEYIGYTDFAKDKMVGIELDKWSPNGHSGSVKGRKYFDCAFEHGIFVTSDSIEDSSKEQDDQDSSPLFGDDEIQIGAKIALECGKKGIIKYIGSVGDVDKLIGIELRSWSHNGHDGKGYFKCSMGRGYFTKQEDIIHIVAVTEKSRQEQLQLKRHRNIRRLRKRLRKILMLEQKAKNGLQLNQPQKQMLLSKNELERQLQALQLEFARATPVITQHDVVSIQRFPQVAMFHTVILNTGEKGKIVWFGNVHFDHRQMIGIMLDSWSPNGHNGCVDGRSYFVAPQGKGLFVTLSAIQDVVATDTIAIQEYNLKVVCGYCRRISNDINIISDIMIVIVRFDPEYAMLKDR